jgi:hypothetical protein
MKLQVFYNFLHFSTFPSKIGDALKNFSFGNFVSLRKPFEFLIQPIRVSIRPINSFLSVDINFKYSFQKFLSLASTFKHTFTYIHAHLAVTIF